ncbi:pyridoxamine 5'-phosphate oxidase family protein [Pseudonocardia thermophila]|uniref:pyridoxamine 5'-phosphate oxidase family protein n=1 Tax=Pseudonocardia thermophila TaxID=1848 RepID=UPI00190ED35B|nr:pyridoxamine 5'-phosphate oxidase family protein [Pseudonocardia thermophila]
MTDHVHETERIDRSRAVGGRDLIELDRRECLRLLATGVIGRVVFTHSALPDAQTVAYRLDGEEIIFRTRGGSKLAAAVRHAVVGFQVDEVDIENRTGWSVFGIGEAYEVVDPVRLKELAELDGDPWVRGHDAHTISIPLQLLSGRRLGP